MSFRLMIIKEDAASPNSNGIVKIVFNLIRNYKSSPLKFFFLI